MNVPNIQYIRGRNTEYKAMRELEAEGYTCLRASGSHGVFDVIAWKETDILFIQCKREKTNSGKSRSRSQEKCSRHPHQDLNHYSEDVEHIQMQKLPAMCRKQLWVWRDRQGWTKTAVD